MARFDAVKARILRTDAYQNRKYDQIEFADSVRAYGYQVSHDRQNVAISTSERIQMKNGTLQPTTQCEGLGTHPQKTSVEFLQAPAPSIVKEVRIPYPPPPRSSVLRQQTSSLPKLPLITLRPTHIPPRPMIIERLPPLPPKSHDITHNPVQVRIIRQFRWLDIRQEDPQAYLAHYGDSLLDSTTLVQQARAAGVIEDISLPIEQILQVTKQTLHRHKYSQIIQ